MLADNGIELEPGDPLIIRRTLRADGGSRAFVNDQPCSAALLREIGAFLVEIHGQHDDRGLLNPRGHRVLLDAFGRCDAAGVAAAHEAWRAAQAALAQAREEVENAARDRDYLDHSIAELAAFDPQEGEEAELAAERSDMQKGARLTGELSTVSELLLGSDGGLSQMRQAARRLDRMAEEHPLLAEALASLDRAVIEASEAEEKLAAANEALSFDPGRLDAIETRLFDLRAQGRDERTGALEGVLESHRGKVGCAANGHQYREPNARLDGEVAILSQLASRVLA